MEAILVNVGLGFLEGLALIISPCILPILPLILSGSLTGGKSRPLGIIAGFVASFTLATLFIKVAVAYTHLSPDVLRYFAYGVLIFLGVIMVSTYLTEKFNLMTSWLTGVGENLDAVNNNQSGFVGGLVFGGLIGIVWTPCAGPILAAVLIQAVIQTSNVASILIVSAFAIGAGIPMLCIALLGRRITEKFNLFRQHAMFFRKCLGYIIIASAFYLSFSSSAFLTSSTVTSDNVIATRLVDALEKPYMAPQIEGISAWINSTPLQISTLRGKVILIDFWTYSCINCIRTLPYLKNWYEKYHDQGFEIIGIHSPEFEFERDVNNVRNAVIKFGIHYPVALDNHFATWQQFHNSYWPAHYLINQSGEVVYEHFGEGQYDVTENNIRYLLGLTSPVESSNQEVGDLSLLSPETYLGYARADRFSSFETVNKNKLAFYTSPPVLALHAWSLNGPWLVYSDRVASGAAGSSIILHFRAGKVYAVMGAANPIVVTVKVKGKETKHMKVSGHSLYTLIDLNNENEATLELIASAAGLEVYTFTFGS
jgi:cytochrome c biogenesis protein CcdA/thiol-disulfide isomerase/thioredoxin